MKILITGGSGFIGVNLRSYFVDRGIKITSTTTSKPKSNYEIYIDVLHRHQLDSIIGEFDCIVNLASINGAIQDEPQKAFEVNCIGFINILESAREFAPHAKIIQLSSRLEHGSPLVLPVPSTHGYEPKTIYGISKYTATKHARLYHQLYGLNTVVLRATSVYGPQANSTTSNFNIVNMFIQKAMNNEEITLFGDGAQKRDYLYVEDLCEAIERALTSTKAVGKVVNLGYSESYSIAHVAKIIVDQVGSGKIVHKAWPQDWKKVETGDFYYDIEDARKILGWKPKVDIQEGISKVVKHYISH